MSAFLWVFLGGGLGASARLGIAYGAALFFPASLPLATLICNAIACFLLGCTSGWIGLEKESPARLFLQPGFLGGLSTFSTFSKEVQDLLQAQSYGYAFGYVAVSLVMGLGLFVLGEKIVRGSFL